MIIDTITDITVDAIANAILSYNQDALVDNLELEDGDDYLLEDGAGFILLE